MYKTSTFLNWSPTVIQFSVEIFSEYADSKFLTFVLITIKSVQTELELFEATKNWSTISWYGPFKKPFLRVNHEKFIYII